MWVWVAIAAGLIASDALAADEPGLIANGSFEADGSKLVGVGYVAEGNALTGWTPSEAVGVARATQGHAFFDNGVPPDGEVVAVLQNRTAMRQEIGPLVRDQVYRLRLRANGRASDQTGLGHYGSLLVRLNETVLLGPVEVAAVDPLGQHETPFHTFEAAFYTGGGRCLLELSQVAPGDGVSVMIDDIRVEPVDTPLADAIRVNRARVRGIAEPVAGVDFRSTQWIWSAEGAPQPADVPAGTRYFRRTFDVPDLGQVTRALVIASADNSAQVYINGVDCGTAGGFSNWYEMDCTEALRAGRNVLAAEVANAGDKPNPAGFAAMLVLYDAAGQVLQALPTGPHWRVNAEAPPGWLEAGFDDVSWPSAVSVGPVGCAPWGSFGFLTWLVPDDFPHFRVPGHERYMELLQQLHWLHYGGSGPKATLWDGWMSMCSLWPAVGQEPSADDFRAQWRAVLPAREIDHEGYVGTHQHHGFGHGGGWPFPTCFQAQGVGYQFAVNHVAYRVPPVREVSNWQLQGLETVSLDETEGWSVRVTDDEATLVTPDFDCDSFVAPFIRLEWRPDFPPEAEGTLEWATADAPEFGPERSLPLHLEPDVPGGAYTHVPLYRHPEWKGRLTRLRLTFRHANGGTFRLLGLITAPDTRHPVNNSCYLQGCTEYFNWTGDRGFLSQEIGRMRTALRYALTEFQVEANGCVLVPWVGHSGRSGLEVAPAGTKTIRYGEGIGANYWDLLPFSGYDCLATIYLYDAMRRMAALEEAIAAHPDWGLPAPPPELSAARLQRLADNMAARGRERFWNPETGRFVACVDTDGVAHDYGYTFVNCEAIYYGFASSEQARSILDWLDGRRVVSGDTATGADIYHWRFGPRASTRRNVEWYTFPWSGPESIPWGGQVQDGGAVLGFAFHDQMARLMTAGPDDAWRMLRQTLDWFAEVRAEGGYRAYYAVPGRGTLQGGGPPGGLGMDCEFFESALVPQIMLYGFLGFRAEPDGFLLDPRLPADWPELRVTRIHYRDAVLTITARPDSLLLTSQGQPCRARLRLPEGWTITGQGTNEAEVALGGGAEVGASRG
ncbi:MAG: hypothetical protein HPY69_05730 [Armatimonadetes bacterium]|nr:hypothetical protein [Armatimonadota bacterium]